MIDSKFIIKYTNALYSTPVEVAPRYDEFRDMFSSGQIESKLWLLDSIKEHSAIIHNNSVVIVGAWFGTLGLMLKRVYPDVKLTMLDIDPRCEQFIHNIIYDDPSINCVTADMYEYDYKENIVINTSCEHIANIREWLNVIPLGRIVILQSNNFVLGNGHIGCVSNEDEFAEKANLKEVWFKGKLVMPMYTRYMLMGLT
jgi:hypothetical protein